MTAIEPPAETFRQAALPDRLVWPARPTSTDLAKLPNVPAIYLLEAADATPIQLATTQALRRLLISRLAEAPPTSGRADLSAIARGVRWRALSTAFEGRWWYYRLARAIYPRDYRTLISFGPAWFLGVDFNRAVPELRVTERFTLTPGDCLGPWPTHAAVQEALTGLWDLFDLCRYPAEVRRTPHGKRCAYAEMGRCDAPCDGSVPLAPYVERCRVAWEFACGGVTHWLAAAEAEMRNAAAAQAYERAAQLKQQLVFARRWAQHWTPVIRTASNFCDAAALPVVRRKAWKLLLFRAGAISEGPIVPNRKLAQSAPLWFKQACRTESCAAGTELEFDPQERTEQAWLWSHLLFSRERAKALVHPLPDGVPNPDFAQTWQALHASYRPPTESPDQDSD